jgi:hypothetical protein
MIVGILNHQEVVEPLATILLKRHFQRTQPIIWSTTDLYLSQCRQNFLQSKLVTVDFNHVNQCMQKDLQDWKAQIKSLYKKHFRQLVNWLSDNLEHYNVPQDYIIALCLENKNKSFVKSVARQVSKQEPNWVLRGQEVDLESTTVVRNIIGNEKIISHKLATQGSMWFIDSGYTNFLTGKKTWHRLVRNHIHHDIQNKVFPADRLGMFTKFPAAWKQNGDKILVVESSPEYYKLIGTDINDWRYCIKKQLANHTDKIIGFKSKSDDRKTRTSVYDLVKQNANEYYCVITHSSSAAVEAIWCGIPVITLGPHVSVPVARTRLEDINNLYRGPIGDWLCAVSYSQFTKKEILDGTALKIMRKFHHV